ncbi:MAG: acetyl-CoA carboxylase biotin carboxyl carrier protein [Myxococcales bacterium]|nr:acetyl-CoA carboxylase biotin carboxyl carrier protein [Myxococcales bacterium]
MKPDKVLGSEVENETVTICRQLADIVESHTLSELIIDTPEFNLIIRRGDVQPTSIPMMAHMAAPVAAHAPVAAPAPAAAEDAQAPAEETIHQVTSPFVGTFYRAPNPDSASYCEVGQRVEKGQVLCIVEAMKLMNEIEADMGGTLEAILVDNAEPVEYGQPLFKIRP